MSRETVVIEPTWRELLYYPEKLNERLEALDAWANSRIHQCDTEIAQHDGTLRVDGKVVATYPEEGIMGRVDQGVRIRASAEKQALEVVLRMLNGELEAP